MQWSTDPLNVKNVELTLDKIEIVLYNESPFAFLLGGGEWSGSNIGVFSETEVCV